MQCAGDGCQSWTKLIESVEIAVKGKHQKHFAVNQF